MNTHAPPPTPLEIVVGKDILELVSSSMYVDPRTIYREYVQNAADSIDEALEQGQLGEDKPGRVDIKLDLADRRVLIRDNGIGVPNREFARRLAAIGASQKRGTSARGFRGIGRLAGLGYCQELIFRSRAQGDEFVQELRWDCKALRRLMHDRNYQGDVRELIREIATITKLPGDKWPQHFYEVELVKPIRIKNDLLLNQEAISFYLSQHACVPFSPDFTFGKEIRTFLSEHVKLGELQIFVGDSGPIYRPYQNTYQHDEGKIDAFTDVEFKVIEGVNGTPAAVVWLLHHGYHGSIPSSEGVAGLRARKGNIQIGNPRIFADWYPEPRFATWTVGEVHVIDDRVVPNGRRDEFEQNPNYIHLTNQLTPVGDQIARLCRTSSIARNRVKAFDIGATKVQEKLEILEQGAIARAATKTLIEDVRSELYEIKRVKEANTLLAFERTKLDERYTKLERRFQKVQKVQTAAPKSIQQLSKREQLTIQRMIALIYECSTNRAAAKSLVDRILARLGETHA